MARVSEVPSRRKAASKLLPVSVDCEQRVGKMLPIWRQRDDAALGTEQGHASAAVHRNQRNVAVRIPGLPGHRGDQESPVGCPRRWSHADFAECPLGTPWDVLHKELAVALAAVVAQESDFPAVGRPSGARPGTLFVVAACKTDWLAATDRSQENPRRVIGLRPLKSKCSFRWAESAEVNRSESSNSLSSLNALRRARAPARGESKTCNEPPD